MKFKLKKYKLETGNRWAEIKLEFRIRYLKNIFRMDKTEIYEFDPKEKFDTHIFIPGEKYKQPFLYLHDETFLKMLQWCEDNVEYANLIMVRFSGDDNFDSYDIHHFVRFEFYKEDYLKFILTFG